MPDSPDSITLVPLIVATLAAVITAIALTVGGAATPIVIVVWIGAAVVGGAMLAVARRR